MTRTVKPRQVLVLGAPFCGQERDRPGDGRGESHVLQENQRDMPSLSNQRRLTSRVCSSYAEGAAPTATRVPGRYSSDVANASFEREAVRLSSRSTEDKS
jgi:hypothetical protein